MTRFSLLGKTEILKLEKHMAEKLFKAQKRKIVPSDTGRARTPAAPKGRVRVPCELKQFALVGTYKDKQLAWIKKNGVYNYPVKDGDEFDAEAFARIKELWLYADTKGRRYCFAADFVKKMTQAEFVAAYPTYAKLGKSKSKAYYVFKTSFLEYGPKLKSPIVLARGADFGGRSAKVKKAIEAFKADGEFAPLAAYLPSELSQVPRERLRVCEAAVQLDFFCSLGLPVKEEAVPFPNPEHPKFTFIDLFAGIGGFRLAMRNCGGGCVFSSEFDPYAQKTYEANFGEIPAGDITKQETHDLTDTQKGEIKWRLSA